jgi:trans-aconitate 2-methyltransferase
MCDWNAERYHEISTPQQTWGRRVLERLALDGSEHVLDIGCGTGRLTALLAERLPNGRAFGLDRSAAMLQTAAGWVPRARVPLVRGHGAALPFQGVFDVVFSAATFHWIHDHRALFHSIAAALRPGGRIVAQCGGGPNLARLLRRADCLMRDARFAAWFQGWRDPWYFADVAETRQRLADAGFVDVEVGLEEAPTELPDADTFGEFISTVCIRHHLERLPSSERAAFRDTLTAAAAADDPAFSLDYWRLNIFARRPAG